MCKQLTLCELKSLLLMQGIENLSAILKEKGTNITDFTTGLTGELKTRADNAIVVLEKGGLLRTWDEGVAKVVLTNEELGETIATIGLMNLVLLGLVKDEVTALRWLADGEKDPFPNLVGKPRSELMLKEVSDDELANMQYLYQGRDKDSLMELMMKGGVSHIALVTAVKERLRWLSRRVAELEGLIEPVSKDR